MWKKIKKKGIFLKNTNDFYKQKSLTIVRPLIIRLYCLIKYTFLINFILYIPKNILLEFSLIKGGMV